ncbi:RagB/SusD family nutrient uptake outer membrane protein [Pedobacter sp. WC2501]|uniref:RagB/SusD family nutrient uptake outer membrane protein n=1 Tax=Pedobacter sp. WC2501 TaxID=3461400 RepID=UPI00404547B6
MKYIYILLPVLLLFSSCSKFLEEYSTDLKYVQNTDDLNKLMIGEAFINSVLSVPKDGQATMGDISETGLTAPWLHVMDDDSEQFVLGFAETDKSTPLYKLSGFHNWSQTPALNVLNLSWEETLWRKIYKRVGAINAILFQAEKLAETSDNSSLQHIRGEAYFLRAYYYFLLQNVYGSPYRVSSAATDEGVPLKISEKIEDNYFKRDNNDKIYKQIVADLEQAEQYLQGYNPGTKIRVGIAAVKILQSRVYLYTEQYDKAIAAGKSFGAMGYTLNDLNLYSPNTNATYRSSNESIFTMGPSSVPAVFLNDSTSAYNGDDRLASSFKASSTLMSSYASDDLRLKAFFQKSAKTKSWLPAKYRSWQTYNDPEQVSCIFSFRYPEVILNNAEALAMTGANDEARNEIHKLRIKRFKNAAMDQIPAGNQELVEFIRAERRRELCFEGHRWFDLRRYAVNSRYPLPQDFTIRHPAYSYNAQTSSNVAIGNYVLKSFAQDAAAWQVPIPNYAIEFNRGSLTNPVRTARTVQPL